MSVSFKQLEKSVKKLQEVKSLEKTVIISDVKLVLRCLTQPEEVEATEYVSLLNKKFDDLAFATSSQAGMGLALRTAFLSYAIVEIDGISLRDAEYVDLEEDQIPKREAITNLLVENWDSDLTQRLWQLWLGFAMEESIRVMEQIQIDTKAIEDQISFHEQRLENLKSRWEALRGKTLKEKLLIEDEEPSLQEPPKVVLENPPEPLFEALNNDAPQQEEPPQKWEDIHDSFLGEDDQESIRIEEARLRNMRAKQVQPSTLNKGLPSTPERSQTIPVKPPTSPQISNLRNAFQTGQKVIMREPEEVLEESPDPSVTPSIRRGGNLNPNFRKS